MRARPITAGELMAELSRDPAYVARTRQQDEFLESQEAAYREAEAPIREELEKVGVVVDSVWHLTASPADSRTAVPRGTQVPGRSLL